MELTIKRVGNGYVITPYEITPFSQDVGVVEIPDLENEDKAEQLALREVIYYMREYFNVNNNKHWNNGEGQFMDISITGDK